jgi:Ca-activated chloride channel family protein
LEPNRIESAKKIISGFIEKQETNRVWLVIFAWKPFVSIPLTFDYNILTETIENISTNNINQAYNALAWTAVWDAILMSETLFSFSDSSSQGQERNREKVIVLITDWDANVWVDPKIASLDAKDKWVKIYAIWIWSEKWWEMVYNEWTIFEQKVQISPLNWEALQEIAKTTSWEFFRATDNKTLESVFEYLEKLEKSDIEIEVKKEYSTNYEKFVFVLILLLWIYTIIILWKREV